MNYHFKVIVLSLLVSSAVARDYILITHDQNEAKALQAKKALENELLIPSSLIRLQRESRKCSKNLKSFMHICIEQNGELEFAHIDHEVIQNSFKEFLPEEPKESFADDLKEGINEGVKEGIKEEKESEQK